MSKQNLEKILPLKFPGKVAKGWKNSVKGWYVENATSGLYTLDIEHIADSVVKQHNDPNSEENVASKYRKDLCPHKCPFCFNEENEVYSQEKTYSKGKKKLNQMMTLKDTMKVIDQAIDIARSEGHEFNSVKFLGPGELTINPQLFDVIEEYQKRNIHLGIFTKGAVLGRDEFAQKYHGMTAKELTDKLASYENISLIFSFQSFDDTKQDSMVTTKEGDVLQGIQNYSEIREKAIENLLNSEFYKDGITDRICMINAPIMPENIDESFEIYKFFTERGTQVIMTPSMVSGKGCVQVQKQDEEFNNKLVDLYARIYAYNVEKGIQTEEQIEREGIASYVGAAPCNQASIGLYVRANGLVQMCPGRFDEETIFANVQDKPLKEIWDQSPNKRRGFDDPHNLINNRCPAKDGRAFTEGFYEKVMQRYKELTKK
ncbi:MAG: radical SAM protein [Nanoarchaeota archaeon]|nr:radical SAM protein [Nanoarchaeota archaeon]